ncbi:MAG: two-component regulator propeller domain-containing protein [Pseudoxanthomonas sp.]
MRDHGKQLITLVFAVLCLIGFTQPAFALDPGKAITQYVHTVWRTEDGLPQNSVNKILETSDGYLWVGTQAGIARFDGVNFSVFDHTNTPALHDDYISDLVEDTQGTLWIATSNGGVSYFKKGVFAHMDGVGERAGFALVAAADGSVWVGGYGGLKQIKNGRVVKTYTAATDGLAGDPIRRLVMGKDGSLWIGTSGGLDRLTGGRIQSYPISASLPNDQLLMHLDAEDSLWIQTQSAGIVRQVQGRFEPWRMKGIPETSVRDMLETRDGSLWLATASDGLFRVSARQVSRFTTKDGLSSNEVTDLYEDRAGNLWVGTNGGGLDRFRDGVFTTYAKEEGLADDRTYAVIEDSADDVWVTTAGGLSRIRGNDAHAFTTASGLAIASTWAVREDQARDLWIGTANKGLIRMNQGEVLPAPSNREGIPPYLVSEILEDDKRQLWVSTSGGGLARYAKGQVHVYTRKDGLLNNSVYAMADDGKGTLWIGTSDGLNSMRGGRIISHPFEGLSHAWVVTLYLDAKKTLWIGTLGRGLFRLEGGRFTRYTTREGLLDDAINSILEDAAGNFWIGSNKGITRLSRSDLDEVAAGTRQRMQPLAFGKADGMKSSETNSATQPSAWRAHDGRLWFPTIRGVVVVDPAKISMSSQSPPARVEQILANDSAIALAVPLRLAPETRRVEIRYTAPSLSNPERTRFRYRLDGFDEQWVMGGPQRLAQYTNLAPGNYTFHVSASAEDGSWGDQEGILKFELKPQFYQTGWFRMLYALAGLCVAWGIYRLRVNWLHARAAVLEERQRIAGEIHDTLAQGLSGIVFQAEAGLISLERAPAMTATHLTSARDLAKRSLDAARYSVWSLSPPSLEHKNLLESLSDMARQLTVGRVDDLDIQSSGTEWALPPEAEHHVVLVTQEAISNAIRHGRARAISIELTYAPDVMHLVVSDDGVGFSATSEAATYARGYGMANMRRRSESLHAKLEVASQAGKGTHVSLSVPRSNMLMRLWHRLRRNGFTKD